MTHLQVHSVAHRLRRHSVVLSGRALAVAFLALVILLAATGSAAPAGAFGVLQTIQHPMTGINGLDGVSDLIISPDGKHLYTCGLDAIMVFERDLSDGTLTPIQTLRSDDFGDYESPFFTRIITSPDGLHLYAGSRSQVSLVVFKRNPLNGRLTFVERLQEPNNSPGGLRGLVDITPSPDGRQVYTLDANDVVGVFSRNLTTGSLQLIDLENGQDGMGEFTGTRALDIASDGGQIYVAGDATDGIHIFDRDQDSGELTYREPFEAIALPLAFVLKLSPDGSSLYLSGISSGQSHAVAAFDRDPASGNLTASQSITGLESSGRILFDSDGDNLYLSTTSLMQVFERDNQDELSLRQTLVYGDNPPGPIGVSSGALDPEDRYLYLPRRGTSSLVQVERTAAQGELTLVNTYTDGDGVASDGLGGPTVLHAPDNGRDVYLLNQETKILAQYRRDETGRLSLGETVSLPDLGLRTFSGTLGLLGSPDGNHLLVIDNFNSFEDPSQLFVFQRLPSDGTLQLLNIQFLNFLNFTDIAFGSDSQTLVASVGRDISFHDLDPGSGEITLRSHHQTSLFGFNRLAISPDQRFVYGSGPRQAPEDPGTIDIYAYDGDSLNFIGEVGHPALVHYADQMTMTSDGRFLFATGFRAHGVDPIGLVVFARDPETGDLSEVQTLLDGVEGLEGFVDPIMGELSSDGHLIVEGTHRITQQMTSSFFQFSPESGRLDLLEQRIEADGNGPVSIETYRGAVWSPSSNQFYVTSKFGDALIAFDDSVASVCEPSPTVLCLGQDGRFRVEVSWTDFVGDSGVGTKVTESADSGLFWFFDAANWEMLVKVIDGCEFNGHHWVFAAATTNVAYTLAVTDTLTGIDAVYSNVLGMPSAATTDTEAFATCP